MLLNVATHAAEALNEPPVIHKTQQKAVSLMGMNIGFVFQNDANFEMGLAEFSKADPAVRSWFGDFLRTQRKNLQNELSHFPNHFLEHRQDGDSGEADQHSNLIAITVPGWIRSVVGAKRRWRMDFPESDRDRQACCC